MSQTPFLKEKSHREVGLSEYMNTVGRVHWGWNPGLPYRILRSLSHGFHLLRICVKDTKTLFLQSGILSVTYNRTPMIPG